jgi:glutathione S-transferase
VKKIFRERLASRLAHVDHHLVQNQYLVGTDFSVADVYLFVVSNWARAATVDLSPYANVLRLRRRVGTRAATKIAMEKEGLIP